MDRDDQVPDVPCGVDALPSFEEFVVAAGPALLRFAHVLTGHCADAEDLAQETLVRVGLAWGRVRRGADPMPYARKTLVNLFLNHRRKRRREILEADSGRRLPPVAAEEPLPLASALALLEGLPPRQRAAVAMRYVLDLDDVAIANALGCTPSTVRSQISRALATLRSSVAVEVGNKELP